MGTQLGRRCPSYCGVSSNPFPAFAQVACSARQRARKRCAWPSGFIFIANRKGTHRVAQNPGCSCVLVPMSWQSGCTTACCDARYKQTRPRICKTFQTAAVGSKQTKAPSTAGPRVPWYFGTMMLLSLDRFYPVGAVRPLHSGHITRPLRPGSPSWIAKGSMHSQLALCSASN